MKNLKTTKYKAIWAWGEMMGSNRWYIELQEQLAIKENAPELAIYRRVDSEEWATLDKVNNRGTQWTFVTQHPELAKKAGFI